MRDPSRAGTSLSVTLFAVAAMLAACASDPTEVLEPGPNEILVGRSLLFTPAHLTVTAGAMVRWRNVGPYDHTVTSGLSSRATDDPGADFDDSLVSGATFEKTFDVIGDHPFFCRPHESMGMKGVVSVVAAAPADASPGDPPSGG